MTEEQIGIPVRGIAPYLFILPIIIGIGVFGFGCFFYVFKLSFTSTNLLTSKWIGLENYQYILFEKRWFVTSLLHTFYFALWAIPLNLFIGLGLGLIMSKKMKFGSFFRFTYLLPWITATIIVALVFRYIFNPEWGIVNWFLGLFGIGKIMWTEHYSLAIPVVAMMKAWKTMGFGMIIFLGAISNIPREFFETADLDGANELQKFRHVTLPLLKPAIFFYLIISIIESFQVFDAVYAFVEGTLGGGYWSLFTSPILVCSYFVYTIGFRFFAFGKASAMAITMFWIILAVILIQRRFLGRNINIWST